MVELLKLYRKYSKYKDKIIHDKNELHDENNTFERIERSIIERDFPGIGDGQLGYEISVAKGSDSNYQQRLKEIEILEIKLGVVDAILQDLNKALDTLERIEE